MEISYETKIIAQAMYMEDGKEFFLFYSTKDERNAAITQLRREKRMIAQELDDFDVEKILIEKENSPDGKFGIKLSKFTYNPNPIAAFIKNPDGTTEDIDLEG